MKMTLLLACTCIATQFSFGQSAEIFYKQGDSLYRSKEYNNAAISYVAGVKSQGKDADISRYWRAAGAWALAKVPDSAFQLLNIISNSDKISQTDAKTIQSDKDFNFLHTDKRWNPLMNKIMDKAISNYDIEELIYGRKDGIALTMLQLKPKSKSNNNAIIWVMAGSWFSSYETAERSVRPSSSYLEKGYTIFLVIVGSQPRYAIPDEIADVKRAIRYIRYNAKKLNIDPNKIGIHGASAGGHLSLAVAMADEKIDSTAQDPVNRISSRVQAVAVLFPPTDCLNWGTIGGNMVNMREIQKASGVFGAFDFRVWNSKSRTYDQVTDTSERNKIGRESSPIYFISPDDPPVFIIHGDADIVVPLQQSVSFIAKLKVAGVPNNLIIKKGAGHNPNDMMPELKEFVDWFDKYLK